MKVNIRNYNKGPTVRKIDVQIDKWDTYGLDNTLALIILPALLQLRATKHGVPGEFVDEQHSQRVFDFIEDDKDEVFEAGVAKWEETLDKMIWSFQQIVDEDHDNIYHHGKMEIDWRPTEKQFLNPLTGKMEHMFEMVDRNPGEHWYDREGHVMHEQRIQEGLELFGKHYRNLWD